jgi:DNA polymerase I-like protein with 3'-5' exonuclease and polymerase domains
VVVGVGNIPLLAITGRKGITQVRGRVLDIEGPDRPSFKFIPTIHPAAILRGKTEYETYIVQDLDAARRVATGDDKPKTVVKVLNTVDEIRSYLEKVKMGYRAKRVPFLALDLETTSEDPDRSGLNMYHPTSRILSINISHQSGFGAVILYRHKDSPFLEMERSEIDRLMTECLSEVPLGNHNIDFDIKWMMMTTGIKFRRHPVAWDSLLASRLLYADTIHHELGGLSSRFTDLVGHKQDMVKFKKKMETAPLDLFIKYGAADVDAVHRLFNVFWPKMAEMGLVDVYRRVTLPCLDTFIHMSINGCAIDKNAAQLAYDAEMDVLVNIKDEFENGLGYRDDYARILNLEWQKEIKDYKADTNPKKKPPKEPVVEIKLSSDPCVNKLIFEVMGIRPHPKFNSEKSGRPSVDNEARWFYAEQCMQRMAELMSLIKLGTLTELDRQTSKMELRELQRIVTGLSIIQEYKKRIKILQTYITPLIEDNGHVHNDGLVHPYFGNGNQETGRTSVTEPGIQIFPKGLAKRAFVSRYVDGLILLSDYSQHELRILAAESGDDVLGEILRSGGDLHKATAAAMFNIPLDAVTDQQRSGAKAMNFGILYGRGPDAIAEALNISVDEAKIFRAQYMARFKKVQGYIDGRIAYAQQHFCIPTPTGRIRPLPILNPAHRRSINMPKDEEKEALGHANRQAVNTPIQGGASDLTAKAITIIDDALSRFDWASKLWGFIHDSILADTHPVELLGLMRLFSNVMLKSIPKEYPWITVPLDNEFEIGINWGSLCKAKLDGQRLVVTGKPENYDGTRDRLLRFGFQQAEEKDGGKGAKIWTLTPPEANVRFPRPRLAHGYGPDRWKRMELNRSRPDAWWL